MMKNYEKYADEIKKHLYNGNFCKEFIMPQILKVSTCSGMNCEVCIMRQMIWLLEDYEEPEVDWSEVEVDTPILVRGSENAPWVRRHFAKYENGDVYAWRDAYTSWTASPDNDMTWWRYAKLAESEESEQE